MNTFSSLLSAATPVLLAFCLLSGTASQISAQQFGGVIPVANPVAPTVSGTPVPAGDAPNVENPPPPEKLDPNAPTETEILATNGADFSSKDHVAVFNGDVRVNDPRFQLACDKLTVFLSKTATAEGTGKEATSDGNTPPAKDANDQKSPGGGIDHAVAEGNVIIIQMRPPAKPGEEPKKSVGRAARAEFDNKTGDMVLRGSPRVEQNGNTHVSLSPSTVMTLHKDNSMTTVGPSRTVITQRKEDAADRPGGSPGPQGNPGGKKRARGGGAPQG